MSESQDKSPETTIEELYQSAIAGMSSAPATTTEPVRSEPLPDPSTDPDDHTKAVSERLAAIQQEFARDRQERQVERQRDQAERDDRDFHGAVKQLAEKAGLTEQQQDLAAGFLMQKASKSEALKGLWDARDKNPEAFKLAVDALASPLRDALAIKEDPQVVENQRALDDANRSQTNSEPAQTDETDRIMKMSDGEFQREWAKLRGQVW